MYRNVGIVVLVLLFASISKRLLSVKRRASKNAATVNQPSTIPSKVEKDSSIQDQVNDYIQLAMTYYTGQGDLAKASAIFEGKEFKKKNQVTREAFERAIELDPTNLDVLYSLASLAILRRDTKTALALYDNMLAIDANCFKAQLMKTIYSKVDQDETTHQLSTTKLLKIDQKQATDYLEKIAFVDALKKIEFNKEVPSDLKQASHGFIILGYALTNEGKMKKTLLERLKIGLQAAEMYPHSTIIVTGGVPKNGITESDAMYDWLIAHGIAKERIIKENKSRDTIQNALETMKLVDDTELDEVTLVTNAKHMRRVMALFTEADQQVQKKEEIPKPTKISQLVYDDYQEEDDAMSRAEEIVIYRDLVRTSGIWQFPNLFQ